MVISPASLVTLSTDRWRELGDILAERAEHDTTPAPADENPSTEGQDSPDGQH